MYVALDLLSAAVYSWVAISVTESARGSFARASCGVAALAVAAAIGTLWHEKAWGHWLAAASLCVILGAAGVLLVLLAMSAAFLAGVYGALGQGAFVVALVAWALVVELYILLPAFQLRYLVTSRRLMRRA